MKKQTEGDNRQRRARAAEAREEGRRPSEEGVTTGASNQVRTLDGSADHEERIAGSGWGKQDPDRTSADPRPGTTRPPGGETGQPDAMPPRSANHAPAGDLSPEDERVVEALARLEGDEAPTASAIAREAHVDHDDALGALQRLMNDHDVVQELPADPELGRRYRVKAR